MKSTYSFSILRFVYDPLTLEFVNVGVVIHSGDTKQLLAKCTQHYGRISKLFATFDGLRLRQTLRYVQDRINDIAAEMPSRLEFQPSSSLSEILNSVLPPDDSSLQFVRGGVGATNDLAKAADSLFLRYVERYTTAQEVNKRNDDDVWRSFRSELDKEHITGNLLPKRIVAKNYEYEFERSWKNGVWHLYEPVSFDLTDVSTIVEKANRWVGRAVALESSPDPFKLFLLLGPPSDDRLKGAYLKAQNLLHGMPVAHEFVKESESADFARSVAAEMQVHTHSSGK